MREARAIMAMTPDDGLMLAERLRATPDPETARRYVLYGAWRRIQSDEFIPNGMKQKVFAALCAGTEVHLYNGDK